MAEVEEDIEVRHHIPMFSHHGDNVKHRQVTELVEESEEDEDPPVPVTALPQITVVLESAKQVVGFNQMLKQITVTIS